MSFEIGVGQCEWTLKAVFIQWNYQCEIVKWKRNYKTLLHANYECVFNEGQKEKNYLDMRVHKSFVHI